MANSAAKPKPKGGRPRREKYKANERVPLSLRVRPAIKTMIDRMSKAAGVSLSAHVELVLEQALHTSQLLEGAIAFRYGPNAVLIETIADAADAARHLAESLAAGEGLDQDEADVRIYSAILEAVRTSVAWNDPASTGKVVNPMNVSGGALTWETLPAHAAWAARNRATMDPKRLAAFKAIGAKFEKMRPR